MAAALLGQISKRPDIVVPALARCVEAPDEDVRYCAVYSLGRFRESARSAIPSLVLALNDSAVGVRREATNGLQRIAPEVLGLGRAP
jgi:HEAT repeat protein